MKEDDFLVAQFEFAQRPPAQRPPLRSSDGFAAGGLHVLEGEVIVGVLRGDLEDDFDLVAARDGVASSSTASRVKPARCSVAAGRCRRASIRLAGACPRCGLSRWIRTCSIFGTSLKYSRSTKISLPAPFHVLLLREVAEVARSSRGRPAPVLVSVILCGPGLICRPCRGRGCRR